MSLRIANVVGARPQFIKAAPISRVISEAGYTEILIHTGQHYDDDMSKVFFDDLQIPKPDYNLGVGSGTHAWQTAQMLMSIESVFISDIPDWVLVYGDTNSTLAAALAASKLHIPLAHIEAGLRSHNSEMPEEINRVLTDHCCDLLFCPTHDAVKNLEKEGITAGVHLVGDVMYDAALEFGRIANQKSEILRELDLTKDGYLLATIHRSYNTDDPQRLISILSAFGMIDEPIIFPMHPRTRESIDRFGLSSLTKPEKGNLRVINPVGYLDMLMLEQNARVILTDSGGVQKEAYFFSVPCVTLRTETEWIETVASGWNVVVGTDTDRIIDAVSNVKTKGSPEAIFGDGKASEKIVELLDKTK